jgi:glyoxylase-like metal-dependent hydrolase (beta-lactamase superfamily II)
MKTARLTPTVVQISLGMVNAFLVESDEGPVLIDAGMQSDGRQILAALQSLDYAPSDVHHILVTHCHADHTGGLAAVQKASGAEVWMSAADALLVSRGLSMRQTEAGPGVFNAGVFKLYSAARSAIGAGASYVGSVKVDHEVADGDVVAGGLTAIAAPGHTQGHMAYLWPHDGGVLFVGDAAVHVGLLASSMIYEDKAEGQRTLAALSGLDFAVAAFSHGRPVGVQAASVFRDKWGRQA